MDNSGTVTNAYYMSFGCTGGIGTELTAEAMKQQSSYAGFDFTNDWEFDGHYPYPKLKHLEYYYIIYGIAFNGNSATDGSTEGITSCTENEVLALTANGFKRTGYIFAGWNTKADGSGTAYADKASVKNLTSTNGKTITLYAQWKKK